MPTLLLIDGNSLMNRAYYGLSGRARLTSPEGVPTGAIMTFLNMLLQLQKTYEPTHWLVAFDRAEPTFRHLKYSEYKAKRSQMPDDLVIQMHKIKEILDDMNVSRVERAGFEADDLLGTFACQGEAAGMDVFIVSGDKDCFQLISDKIKIVLPTTKGGKSSQDLYDRDAFVERYGIEPQQFVDVKALMGDPSDNIPGVKGIGEKSALKLIAEFGSLQAIYEQIDALKGAQKEKLIDGEQDAYASRELSRIDCHVDVKDLAVASLDDARMQAPAANFKNQLLSLGLRQLLQRFGLSDEAAATASDLADAVKKPFATLTDFLAAVDPRRPLALLRDEAALYVAQQKTGHLKVEIADLSRLETALPDAQWLVWDYKSLLHAIHPFVFTRLPFDGYIAQALIEPSSAQAPVLEHAYGRYYDAPLPESDDPHMKMLIKLSVLTHLFEPLQRRLKEDGLTAVFYDIEMPLAPVLKAMETRGIEIDQERLLSLSAEMASDINKLEHAIYFAAGGEFNLNSPKQLAEVLFDKMGLPPGKKNQSGSYSTAQEELDRLESIHPIITDIKMHRQLAKLNATFLQGLLKEVQDDGRVHTTYTQVETATGRLSSVKPNLQNIPIRSERGRQIRDVFVAKAGCVLLDADYSQVELRILAHLADDPVLKAAFTAKEDIHAVTASNLFLVSTDRVTTAQRAIAKTVNFSIVYGVGDFGLAKSLHSSVAEAKNYIDAYNALYKDVRRYLDDQIKKAYEQGYVTTLCGRRRYMHELKSSNRNVRNFGERAAMNAPVQGTAADLIKLAMIRVERALTEAGLEAELLLQVHDELIVEVREKDAAAAAVLLREAMEGALALSVALEAEVAIGKSWGEAKS